MTKISRRKSSFKSPTHSLDFTSVEWFGHRYTFRPGQQAKAIELLWAEWVRGDFCLSEKTIGDRIGSSSDNFRLSLLFKGNHDQRNLAHAAWGTMIIKVSAGVYKLSAPPPRRHAISR